MKTLLFVVPLLVLTPTFTEAIDFHVHYLGEQSNMDGYELVDQLPDDLKDGVPGVWMFHGNMGTDGYIDLGKQFADAVSRPAG